MNLMEQTRKMLADTDIPRTRVARGVGVSVDWLKTFERDTVDPGYKKVERLHDWLKKCQELGLTRL